MINNIELGRRIAAKRKDIALTQSQLADALHVTPQAVSRWETGAGAPSTEILLSMSELFHISMNELIADDLTLDRISQKPFVKKDIAFYIPDKEYAPEWAQRMEDQNWVMENWESYKPNPIVSREVKELAMTEGLILEIGVGPGGGYVPEFLRYNPSARIILSDLSPTVLREWKHFLEGTLGYTHLLYAALNHRHLPFVDGSISVVSDGGGLNNTILGTRQEAVKEIYRVLETGGKLITGLAYISKAEEETLPRELRDRLKDEMPWVFETLYDELTAAGFQQIRTYVTGGWDTTDDESELADLARYYHTNIHLTASLRICTK